MQDWARNVFKGWNLYQKKNFLENLNLIQALHDAEPEGIILQNLQRHALR